MSNSLRGISVSDDAANREKLATRPGLANQSLPERTPDPLDAVRNLPSEIDWLRRRNAEAAELPPEWAGPIVVDAVGEAAGKAIAEATKRLLRAARVDSGVRVRKATRYTPNCRNAKDRVLRNEAGSAWWAVTWACHSPTCPECRQANTDEWVSRLPGGPLWRLEIPEGFYRAAKARLDRRDILFMQVPVVGGDRHLYAEAPIDGDGWEPADAESVRESLGLREPYAKRRPSASQGFLEPSERQEQKAERQARVTDRLIVVGAWDRRMGDFDYVVDMAEKYGLDPVDVKPEAELLGGVAVKTEPTGGPVPTGDGLRWLAAIGFRPFAEQLPVGDWRILLAPEMLGEEPPLEAYVEPPVEDPQLELAGVAA